MARNLDGVCCEAGADQHVAILEADGNTYGVCLKHLTDYAAKNFGADNAEATIAWQGGDTWRRKQ